jgi:hypothetical protein
MRRAYYETHNPVLVPFFEAFHHLTYHFFTVARNSFTLRDEDICFPPHMQALFKHPLRSTLESLTAVIEGASEHSKEVKGHFKVMRGFLLVVMNGLA